MKSSQPPSTSSFFCLNIVLSTLSLNTRNLWYSSLKMRDQVSHPYKTGKISAMHFKLYNLCNKGEDKYSILKRMVAGIPLI
jgi:hypothetical protein